MNINLRYILILIISSTLSSRYINNIHKQSIEKITEELNKQYEMNKVLRENYVEPTIDTVLEDIDKCLIVLIKKINELNNKTTNTIEEKTIKKIDLTCKKILYTIENHSMNDSSSTESFESINDEI